MAHAELVQVGKRLSEAGAQRRHLVGRQAGDIEERPAAAEAGDDDGTLAIGVMVHELHDAGVAAPVEDLCLVAQARPAVLVRRLLDHDLPPPGVGLPPGRRHRLPS